MSGFRQVASQQINVLCSDKIGLKQFGSFQHYFFCDKGVFDDDEKLFKKILDKVFESDKMPLYDDIALYKSICLDKNNSPNQRMVYLYPKSQCSIYKLEVKLFNETINCLLTSLKPFSQLLILLKDYELNGNFIFNDKILTPNMSISDCGFNVSMSNTVFFNEIKNEIKNKNLNESNKVIEQKIEKIEKIEKMKEPKKRKSIPKKNKNLSWNEFIGKNKGTDLCLCCSKSEIDKSEFHCGHVISVKNGGNDFVDNLRPICAQCNLSMGSQNMNEFMEQYGFSNDRIKIDKNKLNELCFGKNKSLLNKIDDGDALIDESVSDID